MARGSSRVWAGRAHGRRGWPGWRGAPRCSGGAGWCGAPPAPRGGGGRAGPAVVGALFGPVIGAAANQVGTGPVFAAAGVAGAALMVVAFLMPAPRDSVQQGLRDAWPALRDRQVGTGMWLTMLAGLAFGVL